MRKLARVFFEDGLRGLGQWRVKKNNCGHVLTKRLRDAGELLGQHPHTDAGVAQSSSTMRVLSPSKAKLANFKKISTWCCSQIMT